MMTEGRAREFETPRSGRKWGPKVHRMDEDELIPTLDAEAEFVRVPGGGGGGGGGDDGG